MKSSTLALLTFCPTVAAFAPVATLVRPSTSLKDYETMEGEGKINLKVRIDIT